MRLYRDKRTLNTINQNRKELKLKIEIERKTKNDENKLSKNLTLKE